MTSRTAVTGYVAWTVVWAVACSQRFEFDVPSPAGGADTAASVGGGSASERDASSSAPQATGASAGQGASSNIDATDVGTTSEITCVSNCSELGQRCAADWRTCVECLVDSDCSSSRRCGRDGNLAHRCVECTDNDCPWGSACDRSSGRCVRACHVDTDGRIDDHFCPAGTTCSSATGICASCNSDNDCRQDSVVPHCLSTTQQCVSCSSDAHCQAPTGFCDPVLAICVTCRDARDCASGSCDTATHQCL